MPARPLAEWRTRRLAHRRRRQSVRRAGGGAIGADHLVVGGVISQKVAALDGAGSEPAFAYVHWSGTGPIAAPATGWATCRSAAAGRSTASCAYPPPHQLGFSPRAGPGETRNDALQERLRRKLAAAAGELSTFYDAEVAWADDNVGRMVDMLRARGEWSSTLFILVSDHGEEVFEHGDLTHGQSLYAELVRVPMIVCHPGGLGAGRRIDAVVSLVDVMPTVLAWAGLAAEGLSGHDLGPLLRGDDVSPPVPRVTSVRVNRHKYSPITEAARGSVNVAIDDGRWRGIWNVEQDRVELYDTAADPAERDDRAAGEPERAAALGDLARRWSAGRWPADLGLEASDTTAMDDATVRRLRQLGYLE
jgi:arylsulfatase A-like enzyme